MIVKNISFIFLFFISIFLFFGISRADVPENTPNMIRVHLLTAKAVTLYPCSGELSLFVPEEKTFKTTEPLVFKAEEDCISCGKYKSDSFKVTSPTYIKVGHNTYRGDIFVVFNKKNSLFVINKLGIDDYLYGVVGSEMPASWNVEALKAQSVAARTYAAVMKKSPRNKYFDLFSTVMDQVYTGCSGEAPNVIVAVSETAGEILTYEGNPINCYFYSSCAGKTSPCENVFSSSPVPYLVSRNCPYCMKNDWSYTITRNELSNLLREKKIISGELYSMQIAKKDESGRAALIKLRTSNGIKIIRGAELRLIIGAGKQKSTKYTISEIPLTKAQKMALLEKVKVEAKNNIPAESVINSDSEINSVLRIVNLMTLPVSLNIKNDEELSDSAVYSFTFDGSGWGHGVGMCQWGAYGLAKNGYTYDKIVKTYYPNTVLEQLNF